jgi:hypothetical protein
MKRMMTEALQPPTGLWLTINTVYLDRNLWETAGRFPMFVQARADVQRQDPSTCVLETGVSGGTYVLLAFVVVLVLVGLAGVLGIIG